VQLVGLLLFWQVKQWWDLLMRGWVTARYTKRAPDMNTDKRRIFLYIKSTPFNWFSRSFMRKKYPFSQFQGPVLTMKLPPYTLVFGTHVRTHFYWEWQPRAPPQGVTMDVSEIPFSCAIFIPCLGWLSWWNMLCTMEFLGIPTRVVWCAICTASGSNSICPV